MTYVHASSLEVRPACGAPPSSQGWSRCIPRLCSRETGTAPFLPSTCHCFGASMESRSEIETTGARPSWPSIWPAAMSRACRRASGDVHHIRDGSSSMELLPYRRRADLAKEPAMRDESRHLPRGRAHSLEFSVWLSNDTPGLNPSEMPERRSHYASCSSITASCAAPARPRPARPSRTDRNLAASVVGLDSSLAKEGRSVRDALAGRRFDGRRPSLPGRGLDDFVPTPTMKV